MNQKSFLGEQIATITVCKVDGSTALVDAEIIGQLAVHRTPECDGWSVTHVLSGHAALECVVVYTVAVEIAKQLNRLGLDRYWNAGCCASQAFYQDATRIIQDVAARHNLHHRYRIVGKVCNDREES